MESLINNPDIFEQIQSSGYYIAERDDGYSVKYSFDEWIGKNNVVAPEDEEVLNNLKKGNVLDLGCGSGRHVDFLERQGFEAKGIDVSQAAVKIGLEHGRNLECTDFWSYSDTKEYDNIIVMDSTIGFISHLHQLPKLFKKANTHLKKEGRMVLTSVNWPEAENEQYQSYIKNNIKRGVYPGETKLRFKVDKYTGDWITAYYFDRNSLLKIAMDNGFYPVWIGYKRTIIYAIVFEKVAEDAIYKW